MPCKSWEKPAKVDTHDIAAVVIHRYCVTYAASSVTTYTLNYILQYISSYIALQLSLRSVDPLPLSSLRQIKMKKELDFFFKKTRTGRILGVVGKSLLFIGQ
jgi:hypothetical protein